jgi:hypothetical protein
MSQDPEDGSKEADRSPEGARAAKLRREIDRLTGVEDETVAEEQRGSETNPRDFIRGRMRELDDEDASDEAN